VTYWFQHIVNTYGIPNYREANPAVLTVVTYPFFFGMMFGDMGHGSLYLMAGLGLVLAADKLKASGMGAVASLRYFLFFMGLQAFYCGFIYNEWFAIGTNFFGSCYDINASTDVYKNGTMYAGAPLDPPDCERCKTPPTLIYRRPGTTEGADAFGSSTRCTYPFGMDPAWSVAENKLEMQNGVKMKSSVIFGVLHMSFGILIKGMNRAMDFKYFDIVTEVVTGFVILWGLFGWMDLQIFLKWFATPDVDDTRNVVSIPNATDPNFFLSY
jgi:V-type H+-transporting ATPase subunit a